MLEHGTHLDIVERGDREEVAPQSAQTADTMAAPSDCRRPLP
jgi:hypothetical protein